MYYDCGTYHRPSEEKHRTADHRVHVQKPSGCRFRRNQHLARRMRPSSITRGGAVHRRFLHRAPRTVRLDFLLFARDRGRNARTLQHVRLDRQRHRAPDGKVRAARLRTIPFPLPRRGKFENRSWSRFSVSEFTGERVIPGAVNDDLWAEHIARYAFARRFATGGKTLDIGCGTGYGIAELAGASEFAVGIDIAQEAVAYARTNYPLPNAAFLRASASTLPFRPGSFRLITAFEVIEHLDDWAALISEARRVLHPDGVFLVSTPNRLYYTDSRGEEGPNPFHV